MVLTNIKTPGVYIDEISLFPPSVAQVATAIPAFVGYTAKAQNAEGEPIKEPVKIASLVEFVTFFGEGYSPATYTATVDATTKDLKSTSASARFYLYDAMRQFYDNGGGDCYVVSAGLYLANDGNPRPVLKDDLPKAIEQLRKYDEPTLLVFPDAVALADGTDPDYTNMGELQKQALKQCADLQDRFVIMDLMEGYRKEDLSNKPISSFRSNIGIGDLKYGAAYYPWLVANYEVPVALQQLKVKDTGDNPVTDFLPFSKTEAEKTLLAAYNKSEKITSSFRSAVFANADDRKKFQQQGAAFLTQKLRQLEKEVDDSADDAYQDKLAAYLDFVAGVSRAFPATAALPEADKSNQAAALEVYKQRSAFTNANRQLIAIEKIDEVKANTPDARDEASLKTSTYKDLAPQWTGTADDFDAISLTGFDPINLSNYTEDKNGALAIIADIRTRVEPSVTAAFADAHNDLVYLQQAMEKSLFSGHNFFKGLAEKVKETMRTIPPSGAIAGVYAAVDRTRGVWKAPANVSLSAVIGPAVKIDNREQDDMNVHTSGKSVNAIRAFTGKGTLVWGARTLAGNDNEWRYVSVRRFFNMVEESVKKATEPFVFEPNDANTWIKVRVMIENFLTLQWRAGALQGAKADEAFFVHVGLGQTMTGIDILEGRMIVEIGMAVVRPAEFIILRFSHKMMEQ